MPEKDFPNFKKKFGPRGVLHTWATDKDDLTAMPRWGKVGKQNRGHWPAPTPRRTRTGSGLDGTSWSEQPLQVQVFFLADRIKELAAKDPSILSRQPFKAFLEHDFKTLLSLGK